MPSEITIKRPVTIILLLAVTVMIVLTTVWMSGKSYTKVDPLPFEDLRHISHRIARHPVSTHILAVIIVPIIANVLLFVPWGFFLFIALYTINRPTLQTYVLTFLL